MTGKKPKARKARKLTDEHIIALREFEFRGLVPDSVVQGLFIYLGVHRTSWIYKKWARVKGKLKSERRPSDTGQPLARQRLALRR